MNVLLIRPGFKKSGFDQDYQECLGLGMLAAVARRHGHRVTVLDGELTEFNAEDFAAFLRIAAPGCIGISIMSHYALEHTHQLVTDIRTHCSPEVHICAGGHLPSFAPDYIFELLPQLDSIAQFEGEYAFIELLTQLERGALGRTRFTMASLPHAPQALDDLDALPFSARDALPAILQRSLPATILSSRGCVGGCTFCTSQPFYRQSSTMPVRFRSAENVVDEIEQLIDLYGVTAIHFIDDDFIGNKGRGQARARAMAESIRARNIKCDFSAECRPELVDAALFAALAEAGFSRFFLGIDSVVPETLALYRKRRPADCAEQAIETVRTVGMEAAIGFIPFHPAVELAHIKREFAFLRTQGLGTIHTYLNRLHCAPGSVLTETLLKQGLLQQRDPITYEYEFRDAQVKLLYTIAEIAVKPLFPKWYALYKERQHFQSRVNLLGTERDRINYEYYNTRITQLNSLVDEVLQDAVQFVEETDGSTFFEFALDQAATIKKQLIVEIKDSLEAPSTAHDTRRAIQDSKTTYSTHHAFFKKSFAKNFEMDCPRPKYSTVKNDFARVCEPSVLCNTTYSAYYAPLADLTMEVDTHGMVLASGLQLSLADFLDWHSPAHLHDETVRMYRYAFIQPSSAQLAMNFELTTACALHCSHCFCDEKQQHGSAFPLEIVPRLLAWQPDELSLTGGDILLLPNLLELLKRLDNEAQSPLRLRLLLHSPLLANERKMDAVLNALQDSKNLRPMLRFTLYDIREAYHDMLCGRAGMHRILQQWIGMLQAVQMPYCVNVPILSTNVEHLDETRHYLDELCPQRYTFTSQLHAPLHQRQHMEQLLISPERFAALIEQPYFAGLTSQYLSSGSQCRHHCRYPLLDAQGLVYSCNIPGKVLLGDATQFKTRLHLERALSSSHPEHTLPECAACPQRALCKQCANVAHQQLATYCPYVAAACRAVEQRITRAQREGFSAPAFAV